MHSSKWNLREFISCVKSKPAKAIVQINSESVSLLYTINENGFADAHLCHSTALRDQNDFDTVNIVKCVDIYVVALNNECDEFYRETFAEFGYREIEIQHGNCEDINLHDCSEFGIDFEYSRVYAKVSDTEFTF